MGWSVEGLPVIQRCARNKAQDGANGGVNLDTGDRYCLEGARLITLADGTDGGNGTEYRTELDTFVRVFSYGQAASPGSGPLYWVVKNKAGETLEFGNTPDSRIEAQGKTSVRVWALNKITDASGKYLTVTYTEDSTNGDYRPLRIDYTGNAGQGLATQRKVEFTYQTRTDQPPSTWAAPWSRPPGGSPISRPMVHLPRAARQCWCVTTAWHTSTAPLPSAAD